MNYIFTFSLSSLKPFLELKSSIIPVCSFENRKYKSKKIIFQMKEQKIQRRKENEVCLLAETNFFIRCALA